MYISAAERKRSNAFAYECIQRVVSQRTYVSSYAVDEVFSRRGIAPLPFARTHPPGWLDSRRRGGRIKGFVLEVSRGAGGRRVPDEI